MTFPNSPNNNDTHVEAGQTYVYVDGGVGNSGWRVQDQAGAGSTNLSLGNQTATGLDVVSSTGTDASIPAATVSLAGLLSAADKSKLDGIEANAAADQSAAEVGVTPAGNLASSDVQAALQELQTDIDNLSTQNGAENYIAGSGAPTAGDGINGDYYLDAGTGDVYGPKAGGAWPGSPIGNNFSQIGLADAIQSDTPTGSAGVATTAARSDHRHSQPTGSSLPADATDGHMFRLIGNANLPDGLYWFNNNHWVQA